MKTKASIMSHTISLDYIIFWSSILTFLVLSHKANGILTDSNDLQCRHVQCPTKCPPDSYLKNTLDEDDEEEEDDYEDEHLLHDPFIQELGHFEELPLQLEIHDEHSPQHILKERQKREVFFQEEIERCCDDQKCVCNKCNDVPKCGEGHVAVEVHEGQGVPGNCCSIYQCMPKEECKLGVKQTWWTSKCKKCFCFGDNELCTQLCPEEETKHNCYSEYWGTVMNEAFWKEGRCTSCRCEKGERRCFAPSCRMLDCKNTVTLEDECCPKCVDEGTEGSGHKHNEETEMENTCYSEYLQKSMKDGDTWEEEACLSCSCEQGEKICLFPVCAKLECKNIKFIEGKCCPICANEEEKSDEKMVIVNNKVEDKEDEFTTESTTIDIPIQEIHELNVTDLMRNQPAIPVVDDSLINEIQTTSPLDESEESETVTITLEPKAIDLLKENSTHEETSTLKSLPESKLNSSVSSVLEISPTPETSTEYLKSLKKLELDPLANNATTSTTQQPLYNSTEEALTESNSTQEPKPILINVLEFSSTTEEIPIVNETVTEIAKELDVKETTTPESLLTSSTQESYSETSTLLEIDQPSTLEYSSTISTTSTPLEFATNSVADSSLEINNVSDTTEASSISLSTTETFSSTTESVISSTTPEPKEIISSTTNTPLDISSSSSETSTEYYSITEKSQETSSSPTITSTTSTTSSPYSSNLETTSSTESSDLAESSSTSTTSAPEPLKPLFQPYGRDLNSEDHTADTHHQIRIIFDKIDYVVIIILFIGSMLCIALGVIIRRTKNRKKMYSSIPNSETSLSQTSTKTVLTV
ncbi:uncharacterized protein ACRADG_002877 isoform 1-T2 [Cochliomyia hominivorax]